MQFLIAALFKPKICNRVTLLLSNLYIKKRAPNFGFTPAFFIKSFRNLINRPIRGGFSMPAIETGKTHVKTIITAALELIYPRFCPICGNSLELYDKTPLCTTCYKDIKPGAPSPAIGRESVECYFDSVRFAAMYEGVMRKCIHKFKYSGRMELETLFAGLMADYAEKYMDMKRFDCIIPVPLHRVKLRERTFNQAALLASSLSRKFGIACRGNNLKRVKFGQPQINLSKSERLKDIKGAFETKNAVLLKDKSILLVDDVFTTGATANECSKTLKQAGVKYIEVLALAGGLR